MTVISGAISAQQKFGGKYVLKFICSWTLTTILLITFSSAKAQQPKNVHRIGFLLPGDAISESARIEGVRLALRERGYVEGQNIASEYRFAKGREDQFSELATELARLKVDIVVVSGGNTPVRAVKNSTTTIPIVMANGSDPVEAGLVESLARPGGNVTGITSLGRELGGKRLELFKEAVPKLTRVAVLYNPANRAQIIVVQEVLPVAARGLKLSIQPWEIRAADDFDKVFAAARKQRPNGLYVTGSSQMNNNQKHIVDLLLKSRLPSMYTNRVFVDAGGLMSYGADLTDSYQRVAYYVDRILNGAKPADLPVEQPTKFELVINLKTAKQIGVTIAPEVVARASKLIR